MSAGESIRVDIRTRFLTDDQRCYILFPGAGYRYYGAMQEQGVVFLDLPGFPLAPGEDLRKAEDLVKRVAVSQRIAHWHRSERPADNLPPRTTEELKRFRNTPAQQNLAGLAKGFFHQIKRGDIIIVPASRYEEDVLFGEIDSNDVVFAKVQQYPEERIPARRVKWIAKRSRASIPNWLEQKIPSPNPLRQIERAHFEDIFDIMYERYFFDRHFACKFNVSSKEFSALDNFLFQQIVLYVAALHEHRQEGNIKEIKNSSISLVVSKIEFSEDIPDQRISINSPGHIVVYSSNIIPLVAGVMMTLAAGGAGPADAADGAPPQVLIENTADPSHVSIECVSDIQNEVVDDMTAMGYDTWRELCMIYRQAQGRTQLDAGMVFHPAQPPAAAQHHGAEND